MKTTFIVLILFFSTNLMSQTTDFIYLPSENTGVASIKHNGSPFGLYLGGYVTTSFPAPYIYTTPASFLNRVGISIVGDKQRYGIMIGGFIERFVDRIDAKPDVWFIVHPLKTIFNTPNGFDFVFAINYQTKVNYGVGISIPFGGIY